MLNEWPHRKWTKENFEKHDLKNPDIYKLFCKFAFLAAKRRKYYSAKIIFHRIRWHTQIEEGHSDFKIDDGWISHYARKFMKEYPEHENFFQTRVINGGYFTDELKDVE